MGTSNTKNRPIVALIYDFDGTLSPGNMQEFGFIQAIGKKPQEFWQESDDIAADQVPFFEIGMKTDLFQSCGHC